MPPISSQNISASCTISITVGAKGHFVQLWGMWNTWQSPNSIVRAGQNCLRLCHRHLHVIGCKSLGRRQDPAISISVCCYEKILACEDEDEDIGQSGKTEKEFSGEGCRRRHCDLWRTPESAEPTDKADWGYKDQVYNGISDHANRCSLLAVRWRIMSPMDLELPPVSWTNSENA